MKPSTCLSCLILLAIISSCSVRKTKEVDPINNPDAITSRTYHDYLTNILDIMREEVIASEAGKAA